MDIERRPYCATGALGLVEHVQMLAGPTDTIGHRLVIIREGFYATAWKPVIDRALAAILLLLLLPALIIIAGLVRWKLGAGVIFRQPRVGREGKVFTILKFRTMLHAPSTPTDHEGGPLPHKTPADPRHTPLGRVLRKLSLDELPQLWNVARGDMSLVGPRPEMVELVELYNLWGHPRHAVRPGLTGRWQISRWRERPLHEHLEEDLPYIQHVTLLGDLRILVGTASALVRRSGS
jgi:lipopolysaccharide/colanic/teichoic acid biosynthesis glycosyltransferase